MAKKIQAWTAFGPRVEPSDPMSKDEIIENIVSATNQSKGSVLAVLAELDVQLETGLKAGRVVQLPNETVEKPILGGAFPVQGTYRGPNSRASGSLRYFRSVRGQWIAP